MTSACTLTAAHVCAASVSQFMALMRGNYLLTYRVAREIARRREEAETRIATVLLTLATRETASAELSRMD